MSDQDFNFEELPPGAQEHIRELRREAAKYRTERNDFRDKYADAGEALREANDKFKDFERLQGDYEKTVSENSSLQMKVDRMRAAGEAGIFNEYERLQGEKFEDWQNDAKELAERFQKSNGKPNGIPKDDAAGTGTGSGEPEGNLAKAFRNAGIPL